MKPTPLRIVQISDTHIFADPEKSLLGVNTQDSLKALIPLLEQEKMDMILLTGDIAQEGSEEAYARIADMLHHLDVPIYFVPGNHDDTKILARVYPHDHVSDRKQIILDNWQFILLNSQKPNAVEGYLEQSELDFLQQCLESHPSHHSIIVFHHHPVLVGSEWLDRIGMTNADVLWKVLKNYSNVNTILFGHVHQQHEGEKNGVKYFSTPSTCIQFKKNSTPFALEKLPPGFRWIELFPNGTLKTGVKRIDDYVGTFDGNAKGY
jgi:Icc protein